MKSLRWVAAILISLFTGGATAVSGPSPLVEPGAEAPSLPRGFVKFDGHVYFTAESDETGSELWRTDGTAEGTELYYEFNPGPADGASDGAGYFNFNELAVFRSGLILAATDGIEGYELWRVEPRDGPTVSQVSLVTGPDSSNPEQFTKVPGKNLVVFAARHPRRTGPEPWASNGVGAYLLADISRDTGVHQSQHGSQPRNWTPYTHGRVLFSALTYPVNDVHSSRFLWVTDGTSEETRFIETVNGHRIEIAGSPLRVGERYYFAGEEEGSETGVELWTLTGEDRARMVIDLRQEGKTHTLMRSSYPGMLGELHGELLFVAAIDGESLGLFATDGSEPGTRLLANMPHNGQISGNLTLYLAKSFGNYIYFFYPGDDGFNLYRTDGQTLELVLDSEIVGTGVEDGWLYDVGGNLVVATHGTYPSVAGLWFVDYHEQRMVRLEDHGLTYFNQWAVLDDRLYFRGFTEDNTRLPWTLAPADLQPDLAGLSGSWYDPAKDGQGFLLHPLDDGRLLVTFYGFDNGGQPLWLIGVHEQSLELGATYSIELSITEGGAFGGFEPAAVTARNWGELRLSFSDCLNGTAELHGEHGSQQLDLQRLAGVTGFPCPGVSRQPQARAAGITGSWYDPETAGQGLVMHPIDDDSLVVTMFTYDASGRQQWLIGTYEGELRSSKRLHIPLVSASGGSFTGFESGAVSIENWGSLRLEFGDCNQASAELEGHNGSQQMQLSRLTGVLGAGCRLPVAEN